MRSLLKVVLSDRRHLLLVIVSVLALLALTLASSIEMFTLGMISERGSSTGEAMSSTVGLAKFNPLVDILHKVKSTAQIQELSWPVIIAFLVGVILFKALALFYSRYFTQLLSIKVAKDLRQKYFQHLQTLPMSFYEKYNIGMLASRIGTDASQIATSFNALVTNYLHTPFRVVLNLIICFMICWKLSLVIFFGLPLIVIPVILLTKKVKQIARRLQKNQEKLTSVLIDFLSGIQTVKIFSMELFTFKKYKEQNDEMALLETKTAKYDLLIRPILHTITIVCVLGIMLVGLYFLKMSLSELLMFCGFLHQFYEPVKKFSEENAMIQKGVVAAERLLEVMELDPQHELCIDPIDFKGFEKEIVFDRVWFRYGQEWILKDVSFTIKKGETIALVGATGSGKSTIVNLIAKLYEIQKGEIRIDGVSIQRFSRESLREALSFVPQKPFLFFDTVKANIAYGKDFSDERIHLAAKKAFADEFIEKMPQQYDTPLLEAGKNLSGGQQQRIAIARALVKGAPILILDEATSSLDAISEKHIKDAIKNLHGLMTQVIIAHRLSTIEHADRILFLEKGELLAQGSREELLEKCLPFKKMWEAHFALETPEDKKQQLSEEFAKV